MASLPMIFVGILSILSLADAGWIDAFPEPPHRFIAPSANETFDVIIVGAGGGGLSAAAKLAVHGKKALILERSPRIGGAWVTFNLTGEPSTHPHTHKARHVHRWQLELFSLSSWISSDPTVRWSY